MPIVHGIARAEAQNRPRACVASRDVMRLASNVARSSTSARGRCR